MRRLLALSAAALAIAVASPAEASFTVCTPTYAAGACVHYICVDICGPEVQVEPYCNIRLCHY